MSSLKFFVSKDLSNKYVILDNKLAYLIVHNFKDTSYAIGKKTAKSANSRHALFTTKDHCSKKG